MAPDATGLQATEAPLTRRQILVIIAGLLLGMLLAALDQTIVATALPTIAGDLHGLSRLSWVVTAYLLASTVSTPLWGKLGDLYGRKLFFQAAISEIDVSPRAGWLLLRLGEHRGESRAALARHLSISVADLCDRTSELVQVGYVKPAPDGAEVADELTPDGQSAYTRIFAAAHDRIERLLDDWRPEQHPRLRELVREITHELAASHERPDRDLNRVS